MSHALSIADLAVAYDQIKVLDRVSLTVEPGQLVGLVGPNGAGKSTLLRCALGLIRPQHGQVRIQEEDTTTLTRREIARRVAFVPQEYGIEFAFTVREMIAMGRIPHLGRFQPESAVDQHAIAAALEAADLAAMEDRPFVALSGGERQRVMIARAFAQESPILLLDEPIANLDPRHAFHVLELVRRRVDEGAAAVAALHDLSLAARFCHRIGMLNHRRFVAVGKPADVLTSERLREVFGVETHRFTDPDGHLHIGICGQARN